MEEQSQNLLAKEHIDEEGKATGQPWSTVPRTIWLFQGILFFFSVSSLLYSTLRCRQACHVQPGKSSSEPIYSPANEALRYSKLQMNGSFNARSVYKGQPSKGLDEAWHRVTYGGVLPGPLIRISEDELHEIGQGKDSEVAVRLPEEKGGGYVASLEVFHQLHCLNMLRKVTWKDEYPTNPDPAGIYRKHLDHCIDMLRQHLMCRADTGIVTGRWVEGYSLLYPYFNSWHVCGDTERIWQWAKAREVNVTQTELQSTRSGSLSLKNIP